MYNRNWMPKDGKDEQAVILFVEWLLRNSHAQLNQSVQAHMCLHICGLQRMVFKWDA